MRAKIDQQHSCWICPSVPLSHWQSSSVHSQRFLPKESQDKPQAQVLHCHLPSFYRPRPPSLVQTFLRRGFPSFLPREVALMTCWHFCELEEERCATSQLLIQGGATCPLVLLLFGLSLPTPVQRKELRAYFLVLHSLLLLV